MRRNMGHAERQALSAVEPGTRIARVGPREGTPASLSPLQGVNLAAAGAFDRVQGDTSC